MTYLNQFHKEAPERKMRKIAEWKKTPLSNEEMARYMFRNYEMALKMEAEESNRHRWVHSEK